MDTTIDDTSADSGSENYISPGDGLHVKLDTLEIGGTKPSVGDEVDVTVRGTIGHIRDDYACVNLSSANDEPIFNPTEKPEDKVGTEDELMAMAEEADQIGAGTPYG